VGRQKDVNARVGCGILECFHYASDHVAIAGLSMRTRPFQQRAAFGDFHADVSSCFPLETEITAKCSVTIEPCLDVEFVAADPLGRNRCLPSVVSGMVPPRPPPFSLIDRAPQDLDDE